MWKGSRAGHGRGRPRATLAQWHGTWWLTGMEWSGVGLGHSDTALAAAFTCRLQLPSGPAQCGPAQCGPAQCGLPRGPAERLERLVSDCESASAARERAARTPRTGREAACAAGERVWVLCGSRAVGGGVAREAVECRCYPPREVQGRWEAKCAAVRLGRRGGPARMRAAFPPILSCRLASMSSLSAALMCAQMLPGAGLEPASTIVSSGALGGSPVATRLIFACPPPVSLQMAAEEIRSLIQRFLSLLQDTCSRRTDLEVPSFDARPPFAFDDCPVHACSRRARSRRARLVPSDAAGGGARPGCSIEVPGG